MVLIQFRLDEPEVKAYRDVDFMSLSEAKLLETTLELPIRWKVNDVELLDPRPIIPGTYWPGVELPVFSIDRVASEAVRQGIELGEGVYDMPGGGDLLIFRRKSADLETTSTLTGDVGLGPATEYLDALRAFHDSLVRLAHDYLPNLLSHPWLRTPGLGAGPGTVTDGGAR
jgi:hypothetical protein